MGRRKTGKPNEKDPEEMTELESETDDMRIEENPISPLDTQPSRALTEGTTMSASSISLIPPPQPQDSGQPGGDRHISHENVPRCTNQSLSRCDRNEDEQSSLVAEGPLARCWRSRSCEVQHRSNGPVNGYQEEPLRHMSYRQDATRTAPDNTRLVDNQPGPVIQMRRAGTYEERGYTYRPEETSVQVPVCDRDRIDRNNMGLNHRGETAQRRLGTEDNSHMSNPRWTQRDTYEGRYPTYNPDVQQEDRDEYRRTRGDHGDIQGRPYQYHPSAPMSGHTLQGSGSQMPAWRGNIKLPAFTGKEDWKVWIRRFEAIAERRDWSDENKLDELLPRLQGGAGEFVFTQLTSRTLRNYSELVVELGYRYRVIENVKSYQAMFASRNQKLGETVEEYAAELKRLHYKAYPRRDKDQRRDDLVERFMRGIVDDEVRFLVNFMKKPEDIDEAVFCVVECKSERSGSRHQEPYGERKMRKFLRRAQPMEDRSQSEDEMSDGGEDRVMRLNSNDRQHKNQGKAYKINNGEKQKVDRETAPERKPSNIGTATASNTDNCANKCIQELTDRIKQLEQQMRRNDNEAHNTNRTLKCFKCGENGHYARRCPGANRGNYRSNEPQPYGQPMYREKQFSQKYEHRPLNFEGRPQ